MKTMINKKFTKSRAKKELQSLKSKFVRNWFRYQRWFFMTLFIGVCAYAIMLWYTHYYSVQLGEGAYFDDVVISQQGIDLNEKKYDEVIKHIQQREEMFNEEIEVRRDLFYNGQ